MNKLNLMIFGNKDGSEDNSIFEVTTADYYNKYHTKDEDIDLIEDLLTENGISKQVASKINDMISAKFEEAIECGFFIPADMTLKDVADYINNDPYMSKYISTSYKVEKGWDNY
jgi:hypothetical protein